MPPPWSQELYQKAWQFASIAHREQKVHGSNLPYLMHIGAVMMEVMAAIIQSGPANIEKPDLAIQSAILHDILEDTSIDSASLEKHFGQDVAEGVQALTRDLNYSTKTEQIIDSLARIKTQPREIWMVKLADRISNLQQPPSHWTQSRIEGYRKEAIIIHETLQEANAFLAKRLIFKIDLYRAFIHEHKLDDSISED